jgi:hypothetical protein
MAGIWRHRAAYRGTGDGRRHPGGTHLLPLPPPFPGGCRRNHFVSGDGSDAALVRGGRLIGPRSDGSLHHPNCDASSETFTINVIRRIISKIPKDVDPHFCHCAFDGLDRHRSNRDQFYQRSFNGDRADEVTLWANKYGSSQRSRGNPVVYGREEARALG